MKAIKNLVKSVKSPINNIISSLYPISKPKIIPISPSKIIYSKKSKMTSNGIKYQAKHHYQKQANITSLF